MPNVNNDVRVKMSVQPQVNAKKEDDVKAQTKDLSTEMMNNLSATANINKANVMKTNTEKFELNLSTEELEKRTNKDFLAPKVMLKPDSKEYIKRGLDIEKDNILFINLYKDIERKEKENEEAQNNLYKKLIKS